tara:strand:+ start:2066 stop:2260 length:195 start_codon:yes stop_codon:yes gene_type:complete
MVDKDRLIWEDFRKNVKGKLTPEYKKILCILHSEYYNHKYNEPCTCNGKIYRSWIADINKIYDK